MKALYTSIEQGNHTADVRFRRDAIPYVVEEAKSCLAFSSNGKWLVTGSNTSNAFMQLDVDKRLRRASFHAPLSDLSKGSQFRDLDGHSRSVTSVAISGGQAIYRFRRGRSSRNSMGCQHGVKKSESSVHIRK